MGHMDTRIVLIKVLIFISLIEWATGCAPGGTIDAVIASTSTLSTMSSDIGQSATVTGELMSAGPYTVFSPSDAEGFGSLPIAVRSEMNLLTSTREAIIKTHIIRGSRFSGASLSAVGTQPSIEGTFLQITSTTVNTATILQTDLCGSNGVVHIINRVIVPSSLGFPPNGENLLAVLSATGQHTLLVGTLNTMSLSSLLTEMNRVKTVMAPVDSAFQSILNQNLAVNALTTVIKRLLIPNEYLLTTAIPASGSVTTESGELMSYTSGVFGSATTATNNIKASNGLIHSVTTIPVAAAITPPPVVVPPTSSLIPVSDTSKSVLQHLSGESVWSTFYSIVTSPVLSGVTGSLFSGTGPVTVFAPTEQGWNALPQGVKEYLNDDLAVMQRLLDYHVIMGTTFRYAELLSASPLITYEGATLTASASVAATVLGEDKAYITYSDIFAYNGVIHGIDKVLKPPGIFLPTKTLLDILTESSDLSISAELFTLAFPSIDLTLPGSMTIFVPVNDAWNKLIAGQLAVLRSDTLVLAKVLKHHIIGTYRTTSDMRSQSEIIPTYKVPDNIGWKTDLNGELIVKVPSNADTVSGKFWNNVFDIRAVNGIAHGIDSVILPPDTVLPSPKVWGILQGTPSLSIFTGFCDRLGYPDTLFNRLGRPVTLLVPTNSAFGRLPSGIFSLIQQNNSVLAKVIGLFVIEDSELTDELLESTGSVSSLEGSVLSVVRSLTSTRPLTVTVADQTMNVIQSNLVGSDGIIHITDSVILPSASRVPEIPRLNAAALLDRLRPLQTFMAEISKRGLRNLLQSTGPITVFAPNADGISKAQQGWDVFQENDSKMDRVLRHHIARNYLSEGDLRRSAPGAVATTDDGSVVPKRGFTSQEASAVTYAIQDGTQSVVLNGVQATIIDTIPTDNGIVHVINGLLVPTSLTSDLTTTDRSISTIITSKPHFSIFDSIIKSASFDSMLMGPGPYTILCPTDDAFKAIPAGQLNLIRLRADVGASLVEYHMARQGVVLDSSELVKSSPISAKEGGLLRVSTSSTGDIVINDQARISAPDIPAKNGILHEITSVLFDLEASWVGQLPTTSSRLLISSTSSTVIFNEIIEMCGEPCLEIIKDDRNNGHSLFVPTDSAIRAALATASIDEMRTTQSQSQRFFFTHVSEGTISGTLSAQQTGGQETLMMKDGMMITVGLLSGVFSILSPSVDVSKSDSYTTNGIVHLISAPLSTALNTSTLVSVAPPDLTPISADSDDDFQLVIIIVVCAAICCLLICVAAFCVFRRVRDARRKKRQTNEQETAQKEKELNIDNSPEITNGYVNTNPIDQVGFNGMLPDNDIIESVTCGSQDTVLRLESIPSQNSIYTPQHNR